MFSRLAFVLLLLASPLAKAAGFLALDLPGSQLTAIADDGRSAAGSLVGAGGGGFRWQQDRGVRLLPDALSVRALSPSGRYLVGTSLDRNAGEVATWWDADGLAHPLDTGAIGGVAPSIGRAIDDAGNLRGTAGDGRGGRIAFRWSAAGGLSRLADDASPIEPMLCASAVTDASTPEPSDYLAASRDGALRVGHAGSGSERRAIVWTAQNGVQRLEVFLAAHGVEVPRGWTLLAASAVDPDARRIGGYGLHQHRFDSFIAELPANVRILCDSLPPPTASQRREHSQEITP